MSWVRHADFYDEEHSTPAENSERRSHWHAPDEAEAAVTEEEIRRGYWPWWRRTAAAPLLAFIYVWRKAVSPLYGQVCSFYPSCSAYGLEAVTVHGLLKGAMLTTWRVLRCNPLTGGGVDHVPASARVWPEDQVPEIVRLNHPPIPRDPD